VTPRQILHQNFGRVPIADDGEFVSDLSAALDRHLRGEPQPTREAPNPVPPPVEPDWNDEDVEPDVIEVEFEE
jgi:hypothetical protein